MTKNFIENIRNGSGGVRTVCFNENHTDPYVMLHDSAEELNDARLDELYAQWRAGNEKPEENEQFENFLSWLESDKGFIYLPVVDAMKMF